MSSVVFNSALIPKVATCFLATITGFGLNETEAKCVDVCSVQTYSMLVLFSTNSSISVYSHIEFFFPSSFNNC